METYKFEIFVSGVDQGFADILLECFMGILAAFQVKVFLSGVAPEKEVGNVEKKADQI